MDFKTWWDEQGLPMVVEIMIEEGLPRALAIAMVKKYMQPMEAAFTSVFVAGVDAANAKINEEMGELEKELQGGAPLNSSNTDDTDKTMDTAFGVNAMSTPQDKDFCIHCTHAPSVEVLAAIQKFGLCCPNCGKFKAFPLPASDPSFHGTNDPN